MAAAAESYPLLIGAVIGLGVGGVALNTTSLAILDLRYSGAARGKVIGLWSAATGLGQAVGIPVGGLFIESPLGWPAIFWICVPLTIGVIVATICCVEESRAPVSARVDVAGAVALGGAVVLVTLFGVQGPEWGWSSPETLAILGGALLLGLVTPAVLRRARDPIVPPEIFRQRPYVGGFTVITLLNLPLSGVLFLMPLFLQEARGLSAATAGLLEPGSPQAPARQ